MAYYHHIIQLIKETSTQIPNDVLVALIQAYQIEEANSPAALILATILKNIQLAKNKIAPICQDTGFLNFFVKLPLGISQSSIKNEIILAVKTATLKGYLRPNSVNPLNNQNSGDNTGEEFPQIYFTESANNCLEIELLLKGGGSENVSEQISLPINLKDFGQADRSLAGIKKTILQIIKNADGKGCAPGIISVHIGSDRAGGFYHAKKNLLKPIGTHNNCPELAQMENEIINEANNLKIGPMGLGGKNTILDCKISVSNRLPACFFVTVSYMCWALRRNKITFLPNNKIIQNKNQFPINLEAIINTLNNENNFKTLNFPTNKTEIEKLKSGDIVLINGTIFTGRDQIHQLVMNKPLNKDLTASAIYHCGPIASKNTQGEWIFLAAGPTTSAREEAYQIEFIKKTGIKAVIGKGGMNKQIIQDMKTMGAIYLHAIGGAGVYYAQSINKVNSVSYLAEFGIPESLWEIEVKDFLCIVE